MLFTISKRKWLRDRSANPPRQRVGVYSYYTGGSLLDESGKMCCLGFCALQLGATKGEIRGESLPSDVGKNLQGFNKFNKGYKGWNDTKLSSSAVAINDNSFTTDAEKIDLLTKLFKKYKHEIVFVT